MNKYKSLVNNIFIFGISGFATKLITFLLVPLYTSCLSTEEFGITDLSVTTINLLVPVLTLSVSEGVLRFLIDDSDNTKKYVTTAVLITLAGAIICTVVSPLLSMSVFGGLGNYKAWFIVCYFLNSLQVLMGSIARGLNKTRLIPLAAVLAAATTVLSAVLMLSVFDFGIDGYFASVACGSLCGIVAYLTLGEFLPLFSLSSVRSSAKEMKRLLKYSLPLIPNSISWWISNSINRFILTISLGVGATGLFAAASKIPNLMNLFSGIIQQAWTLSAFQEYRSKESAKYFSLMMRIYHVVLVGAGAIITLFSPFLASLLLKGEFYESWYLMPAMIVAFYFSTMSYFFGSIYTASFRTAGLFYSTIVGAIISVISTWFLVPFFGLLGASLSLVLANAAIAAYRLIESRTMLKLEIEWFAMLSSFVPFILESILMTSAIDGCMFFAGILCMSSIAVLMTDIMKIKKELAPPS